MFLGANVPFGLVQLGPTQITRGWDWCSGYHYSDSVLIGFGHMHLSGTGIGDLGDIALLPVSDASQRQLIFSHKDESVKPGYYSLKLADPGVKVELTASERVGFHRYTFDGGTGRALMRLDLVQGIGWDKMTDCLITQESDTRITGYRRSEGWSRDQRIYFSMDFSKPVRMENRDSTGVAIFSVEKGEPLLVKVPPSALITSPPPTRPSGPLRIRKYRPPPLRLFMVPRFTTSSFPKRDRSPSLWMVAYGVLLV